MTRLPRSLNDLRGLRAARWIRESTRGQYDNFGPDAQRDHQDRALERYGLVDSGIAWQVAHSGGTIAKTPAFGEMLARAGVDYDVLVVGYTSRFSRNLKDTLVAIEDKLHAAGAAVLFCDERLLSSDPDQWELWTREAHAAEVYRRQLARRISEGFAAKFNARSSAPDQGGTAPLGFRRAGERHMLEVDLDTIGDAVRLFERYASGSVSLDELGEESGLAPDRIREILRNPIYNGWVRRHRRSSEEERRPAAWRDDPPVPDELWLRVQEVRADRWTGGGGPQVRAYALGKRLWCECGRRLRSDSNTSKGHVYRRYVHPDPCPAWSQRSYNADVFETPITAQVEQMHIGARLRADLKALAGSRIPAAVPIRRRQLERELADKAALHARRALSTDAYLAEHRRLVEALEHVDHNPETPIATPDVAERWLRDVRSLWRRAGSGPRGEEARARLVAALYQRVIVRDDRVIAAELTPDAFRHGAALALPELVQLARPAGVWPAHGTNYRISLIGRRELLRIKRSA